jgi:hypothetical protein
MDIPDPPEGWALRNLNEEDISKWVAFLHTKGAYVYGYGATARYAILDAIHKIGEGEFFEHLSGMQPTTIDLVKALGIKPKPTDVRRI